MQTVQAVIMLITRQRTNIDEERRDVLVELRREALSLPLKAKEKNTPGIIERERQG